jgi:hypothetical protein
MPGKSCRAHWAAVIGSMVLLASGCGSPLQRAADSIQETVDLMKSITDPNSARASIPDLKPTFTEMADATSAAMGNTRISITNLGALADVGRALGELDQECQRLDQLKGLPVEFWDAFRLEWTQSQAKLFGSLAAEDPTEDAGLAAGLQQVLTMLQQHGPQRTVEITLTNVSSGDKDAAIEKIRTLAGGSAQVASFENPDESDEWLVAVAPVDDFDKLIAGVDFGTVTEQEKAKCGATVELAAIELAANEEVYVEADPTATASEFDGEYGRDGMMTDASGAFVPGADGSQATLSTVVAGFSEFTTKLSGFVPRGAPGEPMFYHPNYHAQLAEHLFDAQSPFHEKAVLTLLNVPPGEVTDKKVRGRIAQGYRQVAFAEGSTHAAAGVRGLVVWGGKFSAPLLIELLEKSTAGGMGVEEALYEGLGALATPECAAAVVARISVATSSPGATECLRRMGPVAEQPLVDLLPFESAEANLAAINLLADIGTRKCNAILRKATKSENEDVASAALEAIRKIRDRERQTASAK